MNFDTQNLKAWNNLVSQFFDTYYYNELRWALLAARSTSVVGKNIVKRNINIEKRYHPLFTIIEAGLDYSLVLSICHFFDLPKKRIDGELKSIPFFLNKLGDEAKKIEFKLLKKNHRNTIDKFQNARNDYFAHRKTDKVIIPSFESTKKILKDIGEFINSMGRNIQATFLWNNINDYEVKKSLENLFIDLV